MKKKDTIYVICLIILLLDQIIKAIVINNMALHQTIELIPHFFSIYYLRNTGGAFSILGSSTLLLTLISAIVVVLLNCYLLKEKKFSKISIVAYGLLLGGILGNLFDRMIYQYVIDYLSFQFGSYSFPVFNFADIAIVVGVILFGIDVIGGEVYEFKNRQR